MMEAILRAVWQGHPKEVDVYLKDFIDNYVAPIAKDHEVIKHRKIIRASKSINSLLLKNKKQLMRIYDIYMKDSEVFFKNLLALDRLINHMEEHGELVPLDTLKRCFIYSQMTVKKENVQSE